MEIIQFGGTKKEQTELAQLVLSGEKYATSSLKELQKIEGNLASQVGDLWEIRDGEHPIAKCSQEYIDDKDSKEILLIDKKGTEFHITPIDKTHIKFQQVSKDGTLGSTDAVELVKKNNFV